MLKIRNTHQTYYPRREFDLTGNYVRVRAIFQLKYSDYYFGNFVVVFLPGFLSKILRGLLLFPVYPSLCNVSFLYDIKMMLLKFLSFLCFFSPVLSLKFVYINLHKPDELNCPSYYVNTVREKFTLTYWFG